MWKNLPSDTVLWMLPEMFQVLMCRQSSSEFSDSRFLACIFIAFIGEKEDSQTDSELLKACLIWLDDWNSANSVWIAAASGEGSTSIAMVSPPCPPLFSLCLAAEDWEHSSDLMIQPKMQHGPWNPQNAKLISCSVQLAVLKEIYYLVIQSQEACAAGDHCALHPLIHSWAVGKSTMYAWCSSDKADHGHDFAHNVFQFIS